MSIDYKGYKYAVATIQGDVLFLSNDKVKVCRHYDETLIAAVVLANPEYKEESKVKNEIPEGATHKHKRTNKYIKVSGVSSYEFKNNKWHPIYFSPAWINDEFTPIKQDKEMNIDWNSKKAEGCDWALYCKEVDIVNFYTFEPSHGGSIWHCKSTVFDGHPSYPHYKLHTRPKTKEMIYTKQMQDAGELPKVGMSIMYSANRMKDQNKHMIISVSSSNIGNDVVITMIASDGACKCGFWNDGFFFGVIDTRTDKEKAIDDINEIYKDKSSYETATEFLMSAIQEGKIHGITFTGDK